MCSHVDMLRYDETLHHPFVFSTFSDSLRSRYSKDARVELEHALMRALLDPEVRTAMATPHGKPDALNGWAVGLRGVLLYAYVRFPYRCSKIVPHVGSSLIREVCDGDTICSALWTIDASRMAAHGFPIRYDLDEHSRFLQLAR